MSVTPQSGKTVSLTSQENNPAKKGPTPKNEFKVPINQRSIFNSPTDALVSPCTQKLMKSRRAPRKPMHMMSLRPRQVHSYKAHSALADKENKHTVSATTTTTTTATATTVAAQEESKAPQQSTENDS